MKILMPKKQIDMNMFYQLTHLQKISDMPLIQMALLHLSQLVMLKIMIQIFWKQAMLTTYYTIQL